MGDRIPPWLLPASWRRVVSRSIGISISYASPSGLLFVDHFHYYSDSRRSHGRVMRVVVVVVMVVMMHVVMH